MARVSISEAARLVKVSRPTIYKMINSGKLSYTSVVKHGKAIKVIDTSELIRVFGSLDGVIDTVKYDVKSDAESTGVNSVGLHDLQHRIALLEAENDGLGVWGAMEPKTNVRVYHRRSVPSSHAFASTLQLHKSASRFISDRS